MSFVYPEKLVFECTRCGDCCRGWQVMLGAGEVERIVALDWKTRADDLDGETLVTRHGKRSVLSRRADGACVFLGDDNQCRIHEHFGGDAKPLMCRMFPFGFLPVGDRVAVDVSFACRSVSDARGQGLEARVPEWTKLIGDARDEGRHPFSKKYDVDGELLWELEHYLLGLIAEPSLTLVERVAAVSEFVRLATTSDPKTDAARRLRDVIAAGAPKLVREREIAGTMDKTQRAIFFHLVFLLLNPTPPELHAASGKARQKEVKRRVQAADAYKFEKAHPWVDNRELQASYRDVDNVAAGIFHEDAIRDLVARYLEAKIVGQRFMREGDGSLPFIEAVPRLLLQLPIVVWTAKALAADGGKREVETSHVRGALRLVDRSFGEVRLSELPAKQRKAWDFVLRETELPVCASLDMLDMRNRLDGGAKV